jgi:hypothetical protein
MHLSAGPVSAITHIPVKINSGPGGAAHRIEISLPLREQFPPQLLTDAFRCQRGVVCGVHVCLPFGFASVLALEASVPMTETCLVV